MTLGTNTQEQQKHALQPHLDGLRTITAAIRVCGEQLHRMVKVTAMVLPKQALLTEDTVKTEGK